MISLSSSIIPVLFNFNKGPCHLRPPHVLFGWLLHLGPGGQRSNYQRQLIRFSRLAWKSHWGSRLFWPIGAVQAIALDMLVAE